MPKQRVLVTVKTYPQLSSKYGETVCTAGIRPDGSWVRIYPVPFRRLGEDEQYRKYDWLELDLERNQSDLRPETFRPLPNCDFTPVGHLGTEVCWRERRQAVLGTCRIYTRLADLIADAKADVASLALFRPRTVLDLLVEADEPDWKPARVETMRAATQQLDMFADNEWQKTFRLVRKLPYKFSYRFEDEDGRKSDLQILDWEIGALFWNCLRSSGDDAASAIAKVRQKYLDEFRKTDLHFFMGTTLQFHRIARNPWLIVGVFQIPFEKQRSLFP